MLFRSLGSWYGNASLILSLDKRFDFDKIINVETDRFMLKISQKLADMMGDGRIEPMLKDANKLDYRQLGQNGLVINFSCGNISGTNWFDNIPPGTTVLLSGRNNDRGAVNHYKNLKDFAKEFNLSNRLFVGQKTFKDPETEYELYLVIGQK